MVRAGSGGSFVEDAGTAGTTFVHLATVAPSAVTNGNDMLRRTLLFLSVVGLVGSIGLLLASFRGVGCCSTPFERW